MDESYVSVIIPVFNQKRGLEETLNSLSDVNFPKERLEIIVIDNNSTDGSLEYAESFNAEHPGRIRIEKETNIQSSYAARNKGLALSKGETIIFLDTDIRIPPDLVTKILDHMKDSESGYTGCCVKLLTNAPENIWEKFDRLTGFPVENYLTQRNFLPTCCLAITKDVLSKTGTFNNDLESGGDYEFGNRVHKAGIKQTLIPGSTVSHPARNSFMKLAKKAYRVGKGRSMIKSSGITLDFDDTGQKTYIENLLNSGDSIKEWKTYPATLKIKLITLSWILFSIKCSGFIFK